MQRPLLFTIYDLLLIISPQSEKPCNRKGFCTWFRQEYAVECSWTDYGYLCSNKAFGRYVLISSKKSTDIWGVSLSGLRKDSDESSCGNLQARGRAGSQETRALQMSLLRLAILRRWRDASHSNCTCIARFIDPIRLTDLFCPPTEPFGGASRHPTCTKP